MAKFYLVRHGELLWSLMEERKMKGAQRDLVPLTEERVREVEQVAKDRYLPRGGNPALGDLGEYAQSNSSSVR